MRGKRESNRVPTPRSNQEVQRQILLRSQVWPKRQDIPQQWILMGPTLMEGVEKTNMAIMKPQQTGVRFPARNPYIIDIINLSLKGWTKE